MTSCTDEARKTPWYPPHIKPVRKGLYQATVFFYSPDDTAPYMRWDGAQWINPYNDDQPCMEQNRAWRGLSKWRA